MAPSFQSKLEHLANKKQKQKNKTFSDIHVLRGGGWGEECWKVLELTPYSLQAGMSPED